MTAHDHTTLVDGCFRCDLGKDEVSGVEFHLEKALDEIETMMLDRHRKYGPGNIAKHGPVGILVRMDDKFARLEAGQGNFDDETVENTLDDIIGYALIWKLWLRGHWPGSPHTIKPE